MELKPEEQPKGSLVIAFVFLACFVVYYFLNWVFLFQTWPVGG